jgi:virginiamycin B lyase
MSAYRRPNPRAGLAILATVIIGLLGRPTTAAAQTVVEYPLATAGSEPVGIAAGPDGALWFTEYVSGNPSNSASKIGRITTNGTISEFALPTATSTPQGIVAGPDGALWFVEAASATIGRITTAGAITEFAIPLSSDTAPDFGGIAVGSDGALWFPEGYIPALGIGVGTSVIGRITLDGTITSFMIPQGGNPFGIAAGPDGALWVTGTACCGVHAGLVDRLTTSGASAVFQAGPLALEDPSGITAGPDGALWFAGALLGRITTAGMATYPNNISVSGGPNAIAAGPDGALWFFQEEENTNGSHDVIGRITTAGTNTQFLTPTTGSFFQSIVAGPDGAMWFTEFQSGKIGRISVPASTSPLVAAVLPSSRSVQSGVAATAFATIINAGTSTATSCAIAPITGVPASFLYQTTIPTNNALTGTANTPVTIPAGGSQSFFIAFTTNAPFVPIDAVLGFDCAGTDAAQSVSALNTLLLSGSTTPAPDVIALGATVSNDGILHIPGAGGSAAFAVATVDVGAGGTITATANTRSAALPLALSVCQTNPATGACMAAPSTSVTTTIAANATPTFGIFGTASGAIALNPANSRIFVRFTDSGGTIRGETSVAVETQ